MDKSGLVTGFNVADGPIEVLGDSTLIILSSLPIMSLLAAKRMPDNVRMFGRYAVDPRRTLYGRDWVRAVPAPANRRKVR